MFFRLHNYVYKIGRSNSMLYNSANNQWYMLDEKCNEILDLCENNIEIEKIDVEHNIVSHYLSDLSKKGLGTYYTTPIHIDRILPFAPMIIDDNFMLINLYIEFATECDAACYYCGKSDNQFWQLCRSCVMNDKGKSKLNSETVSVYIEMVKKYKPLNIIIRGGNPFLKNKDMLYYFLDEVVKHIQGKITIVCSGMNINKSDILMLKKFKDNIVLNIVYWGICAEDYERVNGSSNIFFEQNKLLDRLENEKIPYLISFNLSDRVEKPLESIDDYFFQSRGKIPTICEQYTSKKKLLSASEKRRKLKDTLNEIDFYSRRKYNACLFGSISVNISREITPCPGIRKKVGKLCNDGSCCIDIELRESYWKSTKNDTNCRNCGLKYMCVDCSALNLDYSKCCKFYDYIKSHNVIETIGIR